MDQAAVDQVAKIFLRAQAGERLDPLPAAIAPKNYVESCAVMDAVDKLVGDDIVGTKIAAKPGAEVVYRAARVRPRVRQPGARAARAHAEPVHGMRDQLPPDARSAAARHGIFGSRSVRRARKAAPPSNWSTAASAI